MDVLRTFRGILQAAAIVALASCARPPMEDLADLESELSAKTQEDAQLQEMVQQLRSELNVLDRQKLRLSMSVKDESQQIAQLQKEIVENRRSLETAMRTGVEPSTLQVGSFIPLISLNGRLYKNVKIKTIDGANVTITHADGVSKVKSVDLLGQIAPIAAEPPWKLPDAASAVIASIPSSKTSAKSKERTSSYSYVSRIPESVRRKTSTRARARTVDILSWWGPGSPDSANLRDAFGRSLTTHSPSSERGYSPSQRAKLGKKTGSALSSYRPIGWNYDGSSLDKIYGTRP